MLDFSLFSSHARSGSMIEKDLDATKYDEIAEKLCSKRRSLEEELAKENLSQQQREETMRDLEESINTLRVFGISEVDYQAYLAYQEKHKAETDPTLF